MSYYLEQLQKKGIKLNYEQEQARKASKLYPQRKTVSKMRLKVDEIIRKEVQGV